MAERGWKPYQAWHHAPLCRFNENPDINTKANKTLLLLDPCYFTFRHLDWCYMCTEVCDWILYIYYCYQIILL